MNSLKELYSRFFSKVKKNENLLAEGQLPKPDGYDFELASGVINSSLVQDKDLIKAANKLVEAHPELHGIVSRTLRRHVTRSERDFSPQQHLKIIQRASDLAELNPYAARAMEIRSNLIVSEGLYPKATCESETDRKKLQKILDEHWILNEWDSRMLERVKDLGVTGEMIRQKPPTTRVLLSGETYNLQRFRCNTIRPENVVGFYTDSFDCDWLRQIVVRQEVDGVYGYGMDKILDIVEVNSFDPSSPKYSGEVFVTSSGRRPGSTRGRSDLLPVLEWLDISDQVLFNDSERSAQMLKFLFDIAIDNATPGMILQREKELRANPPTRGSNIIHPSTERWSVVQPEMQGADSDLLENRLFLVCWGAMGLPEHWYAQANTVNKSSGEEMSIPVWSWARSRKMLFTKGVSTELAYAIQVAKQSGSLDKSCSEDFILQSRDPDRTAYDLLASALDQTSRALQTAQSAGMIDRKSASEVFVHIANAMGLELPDQVVSQVENMTPETALNINKDVAPSKDVKLKSTKEDNNVKKEK